VTEQLCGWNGGHSSQAVCLVEHREGWSLPVCHWHYQASYDEAHGFVKAKPLATTDDDRHAPIRQVSTNVCVCGVVVDDEAVHLVPAGTDDEDTAMDLESG